MLGDIEGSTSDQDSLKIFNGFRVIDAHLEARNDIENYVHGITTSHTIREDICHPECLFGQWLHGEAEKTSEHLPLFNTLCQHCETFHETMNQAATFKKMGDDATAKLLLTADSKYAHASAQFQDAVFNLHDVLHQQYRHDDNSTWCL
jgi:hypothetical protein